MYILMLFKEFILFYVGWMALYGQPLDIPIIIRMLGDFIPGTDDMKKLIPFDAGLRATLDAGDRQVLKSYELQWWTGPKPQDLRTVETFNRKNLSRCLKHYKQQLSDPSSYVMNLPAGAMAGRNFGINEAGSKSMSGVDASKAGESSKAGAGAIDTNARSE